MQLTKQFLTLMLATGLTAGLTACDPANVKNDELSQDERSAEQQNKDGVILGDVNDDGTRAGRSLNGLKASYEKTAIHDVNSVLAEKVIYFEYNSDQMSEDYQVLISHHGRYLAANRDMKVRLEGHADERGSREYNVALANRRAQAVRKQVLFQGVNADQLSVISYGEEKPVSLGHDEESWRLNRRVELVYEAR